MAKQAKEIRVFNKGIISSVSVTDTPDESCQFSLNIEPITETGTLQGIGTDTNLYPDSENSTFVNIDKMVMLDRGHAEDLFIYVDKKHNPDSLNHGLNYIKDWYGARDIGTEWQEVNCTFGVPCFQKHNKEMHIGFGYLSGDSKPKWMGYTKNKQFGSRVASGVLIDDAELKSPDLGNGVFAMDKTINIEKYFIKRPHSNKSVWTATPSTQTDPARWTEELGTNTWLYGMKIGEPYIYRIKTEDGTNDPAVTSGGQTMSGLDEGKFIRSNPITDTAGKILPLSSITASRRFKNCLWAVANINNDLRLFLIDVNDYYETHGWDNDTSALDASITWSFKADTQVIAEYSLNLGTVQAPDGPVEEVPAGEWKISDILETFECSTSSTGDEADTEWSTSANGFAYEGGTGKVLENRLWFQLYKEGGFVNKMFNVVTVEPFLYSTDILEITTTGTSLSLINETLPMRRCTGRTKAYSGTNKTFYSIDELWTFSNAQGPNWLASGSSGWDVVKYIGEGNLDADDHGNQTIPMGWNMGFTDDDEGGVVHVKEHSLAWLYGRGGYYAYNNTTGTAFDDINIGNGYGPHQVGVLCYSESSWVKNGGALGATGVGGFESYAWCPTSAGETIELGIFIMISNHDLNLEGYNKFFTSEESHDFPDGPFNHTQGTNDLRYPTEACDIESDRALYRLDPATFSAIDWNNVKNFTSAYNNVSNDNNVGSGSIMTFITEGIAEDDLDSTTMSKTKIWQLNPRGWYANTAMAGIDGEVQVVKPNEPIAAGVPVPPFTIENSGKASISVHHNYNYPSSVTAYYSGINEYALNIFGNSSVGEHLSFMIFGSKDNTNTNTEFWATVSPTVGGQVDSAIPLSYAVDKSQVELLTDDATIRFDNTDASPGTPHAFDSGTIYRYKLSFMYDGYQHSPLTMTTWSNEPGQDLDSVGVEVNIPNNIPKRVSHVLVWRANDVMDSMKLVAQISVKGGWSYDEDLEAYKRSFVDKGQDVVGESYVMRTNLPESIENMDMKYGLSCQINGYHIIGQCSHPLEKDYEFYLFKSELERFDMFNWTAGGRRLKLPNVPTALAAFNGRIFAFDKSNIYTIEPSTFTVLDTFEGIGCAGSEAVITTEFGMCFADFSNVYLHDGRNPKPIGTAIQTSKEPNFGLDEVNLTSNTKISFDQKRGSFVVFTQKGKAGLYTEGSEYVYQNLPSVTYIGYYHLDGDGNAFSGAYHTVESLKLMLVGANVETQQQGSSGNV